MELMKKMIHMDDLKCKGTNQVTLEDDMNVPDNKSDMEHIILNHGTVKIEEVKPQEDKVQIGGILLFQVLYISEGEEGNLSVLEGKIPFQETLYMEGVKSGQQVIAEGEIQDLNTQLINSRKLSAQAVLLLSACIEELSEEESAIDVNRDMEHAENTPIQFQKKSLEISQLMIQKKDVFRIREEISLPKEFPNIFEILWQDSQVVIHEIKALEEKLSIQGELQFFLLYEGEGEGRPDRFYETRIPLQGVIDCHGCKETYIPIVTESIPHMEAEVRPDFDGEERVIGIDIPLELRIKLYEQEQLEVLSDAYGTQNEVAAQTRTGTFKNLLLQNQGKFYVQENLKINGGKGRILELCHAESTPQIDRSEVVNHNIEIKGSVQVKLLYRTNEAGLPYEAMEETLPFSYQVEAPGIQKDCDIQMKAQAVETNVTMVDSEEVSVKIQLSVKTVVFENKQVEMIENVMVQDLDMDKIREMPSMVIYVVKEGDSLWQIGKKYYISVEQIKELNGLTGNEPKPGEKLLLVKTLQGDAS